MTTSVQRVLLLFLREPSRRLYGLEIAREARLAGSTLYPLLDRLENGGWLKSAWEDFGPAAAAGRRPRRYYQLTDDGLEQAREAHRAAAIALASVPASALLADGPVPRPAPASGFGGT